MIKQPLLSVVIPTYMVEKHLKRCLDSVVNQTYQNLEIIIIDDVSKDSTTDIIKSYAAKDTRIKFIFHKTNKGPGVTRNEGLKIATGKYVTMMDHDDWQDLTKYEKMIKRAEETQSDIVFCKADEYNETTKNTHVLYEIPDKFFDKRSVSIKNWPEKDVLFRKFIPPWMKIVRLDLIKKYDIRFSENGNKFDDVLFHCLTLIFGKKVSFVEEILYTHRYFPDSITGQADVQKDMYFDHFKTFADLEKYAEKYTFDIKKILIRYLGFFRSYAPFVKNTFLFYKKVKALIAKYGLQKKDVPPHLMRQYRYFRRYRFLKNLRKKVLVCHIKPNKGEYKLVILGVRII